jgi:hypothetical protein
MDDIAPPSIPEEGAERLCECCGRRPYTVGVSKRYEPGMTEGGYSETLCCDECHIAFFGSLGMPRGWLS